MYAQIYRPLCATLLMTAVLSGCQQTIADLPTLPEALKPLDCSLSTPPVSDLIALEQRYVDASANTRRAMRNAASRRNEHMEAALLHSRSDATPAMLQRAMRHYNQAEVTGCTGHDNYISLRKANTSARLQLLKQLDDSQQENSKLQQKIDALTGLENELSGQRGLPR